MNKRLNHWATVIQVSGLHGNDAELDLIGLVMIGLGKTKIK